MQKKITIITIILILMYLIVFTTTKINNKKHTKHIVNHSITSFKQGGTNCSLKEGNDYEYNTSLYIDNNKIIKKNSNIYRIKGKFTNNKATDISITDKAAGHNGIMLLDTNYQIDNAQINMVTKASGLNTCEFSGKGSAIALYGNKTNVTVNSSIIHTAGVGTTPLFIDKASLTLKSSKLKSDGGTLYKDYQNTSDKKIMVSSPWYLGILGTSRTINMMGKNTKTNITDSNLIASSWGVISTEGLSNNLKVYNTKISLENLNKKEIQKDNKISEDNPYTENYTNGYGSFVSNNSTQEFNGVTFNVGTYASILEGGEITYSSLEKDKKYELLNTNKKYKAPQDKKTIINSDTFGFLINKNKNKITISKGTEINTKAPTFLIKEGELTASIDQANIKNNGVLIQTMDNEKENINNNKYETKYIEKEGFNLEKAESNNTSQNFTFKNGNYEGNIYNATGSNGQKATTLNINLSKKAHLKSAIASTSAIHINYEGYKNLLENNSVAFTNKDKANGFAKKYQNIYFTINSYYNIGHVANFIHDNGNNKINVSLNKNAIWTVLADSQINSLNITDNAKVIVPNNISLVVNDKYYTNQVITKEDM